VAVKFDLSILYVEDEEAVRDTMGGFFRRRFRDVYFAVNGKDGLEKYKHFSPDIIVTDIGMPCLDGLKMSKEIRAMNSDIPLIFATAFNESNQVQEATRLGATAYLEKPLDYAELENIIIKVVNKLTGSSDS
jgi:two-component system, OmpR family, response regulator VanR